MTGNDTAKELLKKTVEKIEVAYAPATIRAYKSNFETFIKYCEEIEQGALPANSSTVVNLYPKNIKWAIKVSQYSNSNSLYCNYP
jgi:hypothetical protein